MHASHGDGPIPSPAPEAHAESRGSSEPRRARTLAPRRLALAATFAADRGAMLAEAAGFHLARQMPRGDALKILAAALAEPATDETETLAGALARLAPGHDWSRILAPEANTGDAAMQARLS